MTSSAWGNSWGNTWLSTWGARRPAATTGGYSDEDFKRYRKHLEKLVRIEDERNRKLYSKPEIVELIEEIIEEIPVDVVEIPKLADRRVKIDYSALESEIDKIRKWLELVIARENLAAMRERDDEDALLLILGAI